MARPRVIDQDAILDAAELIVARDGAANLTLEAVGIEAGISKASVIYDYKSKQALIRAVVERRANTERRQLAEIMQEFAGEPDAAILGRLKLAKKPVERDALAVSIALCAALAQDSEVRDALRLLIEEDIQVIRKNSRHPRSAMVAYLAVEGFRSLELLGLHQWSEEERAQITRDLEAVVRLERPEDSDN